VLASYPAPRPSIDEIVKTPKTLADIVTVGGLPTAVVTQIVGQLAEALFDLHETKRTYNRLAPATVAVRHVKPLRVDLSSLKDVAEADEDRFAAYRAPECVGASADWWSLGVVAHQLATGVTPFARLDAGLIRHEVALRGFAVDDVLDARLRRLCEGLLQPDPGYRWGGPEVLRWCSGGQPPVNRPAATQASWSLTIAGVECWTREDAARTIWEHWDRAADELCGRSPSAQLNRWLEHFQTDTDARTRLTDQVLSRWDLPVNLRLLFLLRWLDRRQPPTYLGQPMSLPGLSALATRAELEPGGAAGRSVTELWLDRLLPVLADFAGGTGLRTVQDRWLGLADELDAALGTIKLPELAVERLPELVAWQRAVLLGLATQPVREAEFRRRAVKVRHDLVTRIEWCQALPAVTDTISAVVIMSVERIAGAPANRPAAPFVAGVRHRIWRMGAASVTAPGVRLLVLPALCLLVCLGPAALTGPHAVMLGGLLGVTALCMGRSRRRLRNVCRRTPRSDPSI
jgi:hypothetical protein